MAHCKQGTNSVFTDNKILVISVTTDLKFDTYWQDIAFVMVYILTLNIIVFSIRRRTTELSAKEDLKIFLCFPTQLTHSSVQ